MQTTQKKIIKKNLQLAKSLNSDDEYKIIPVLETFDAIEIAQFLITSSSDQFSKFINNYLYYNIFVLLELPIDLKLEAFNILGARNFVNMIKYLELNDILDIIEEFDKHIIDQIIQLLPIKKKVVLLELLSYPEESAGRLIHKDFVVVPLEWNIEQAREFIKTSYKNKKIANNINEFFIINKKLQPIGSITYKDLLCYQANIAIKKVMKKNIKTIEIGMDQNDVADIFKNYSLLSAPVVNKKTEIVGIITIEDIVEVIDDEAEEDMLYIGKVSKIDINADVLNTILRRLPWLFITFITINLSSLILGLFEETLEKSTTLVILMPIIAAMGGNAGLQASTLAVRAISTKQLTSVNSVRLLLKELLVGVINGTIMGLFIITVIYIRFHNIQLEYTFFLVMIIIFTLATCCGTAIPIIVNKFGGDPALSSSIVTSSITDIMSFFLLVSIATLILN